MNHRSSTYEYTNGERKIIDPVVARLKEVRRLEREAKANDLRLKKGLKPKPRPKPKATIPLRTGPSVSKPKVSRPEPTPKSSTASTVPRKPVKMNFAELMKKANTIDSSKLSIQLKPKPKSQETKVKSLETKVKSRPRTPNDIKDGSTDRFQGSRAEKTAENTKQPLPMRRPSQSLSHRLSHKSKLTKTQVYGDRDQDGDVSLEMDDFIEDDMAGNYDRDEIWALFNRKQRSEYNNDYDSDDMEATGMEIFDEELRSRRSAEAEDRRELIQEQQRAEMKRQRRNR